MSMTTPDWEIVLRELFFQYANIHNRLNRNLLTCLKLQKLLSDAQILNSGISNAQLQLIFHSQTKHRPHMTFQGFLNLLPRLAQQKYPLAFTDSPKQALNRLLVQHFLPLYSESIQPRKSFHPDALQLNEDVRQILHSIIQPLKECYKLYFPWQASASVKPDVKLAKSQKALHQFLRDFEICPSLVSKPTIFKIWNDVVVCQNEFAPSQILLPSPSFEEGSCLTFSKLLFILYMSALMAYTQDSQLGECPAAEKLLILLQRMELARQNRNFSSHRPQTAKDSLLPPREVMEKIIYGGGEVSVQAEQNSASISALCLDQDGLAFLQDNLESLHRIFQAYCSFGEPMNTTRLKSAKLIKLLKDCSLLRDSRKPETFDISTSRVQAEGLSKVDVDLIFSRLTGSYANTHKKKSLKGFGPQSHLSLQSSNSYGRMEFQEFLKALELIAQKVFPGQPAQESYRLLLDEFILQLDEQLTQQRTLNSQYTQVLMDMLQDQQVIQALGLAHQVMSPYFLYYSDTKSYMNLRAFLKFCRDFQIFPDIVGKSKLLRFFYTLAGIQARTEADVSRSIQIGSVDRAPQQTELEVIDQHLFIEALALIAAEIPYSEVNLSAVHRICYLMERLSQSSGPTIVGNNLSMAQPTVRKVDILTPFRRKYPVILSHQNPAKRPTFSDLMAQFTLLLKIFLVLLQFVLGLF